MIELNCESFTAQRFAIIDTEMFKLTTTMFRYIISENVIYITSFGFRLRILRIIYSTVLHRKAKCNLLLNAVLIRSNA